MSEPVTFVIERRHGGPESGCIIYGPLPKRLTGAPALVWAIRLDKLPNGEAMRQMPIAYLVEQYQQQRAAGTLPPSNLIDPPPKTDGGQKGIERGPKTWWKPTPLPRGDDWKPAKVEGFD